MERSAAAASATSTLPSSPPVNGHGAAPAAAVAPVAAPPTASAPPLAEDTRSRLLNRELSWLDFNSRVLAEAEASHNPLLERVGFLAISSNNLDEFFMKRVGGLQRQLAAGVTRRSPDGRTPLEQLEAIRARVLGMMTRQSELWFKTLRPQLNRIGVHLSPWSDLNAKQHAWLTAYFERQVLPILTPLGVGPGQPFPFISNLSLNLAVQVRAPGEEEPRFGRVKAPSNRPRWVELPPDLADDHRFVAMEDLIAQHMGRLFVGMEILEVAAFRVTRNADVERHEEEADDLLDVIEEELRSRRFAPIVRLETVEGVSPEMIEWLVKELEIEAHRDVYYYNTPLGLDDLSQIAKIEMPEEHFDNFAPVAHPALRALEADPRESDIFAVIRRGDFLVHHPFQSFQSSVLGLLQAAAADPRVLAIKQTLYRTAKDSPIVSALLKACEKGKEVNVAVEIKARFDEANNIEWVRVLEGAGAHVSYGFVGLKTHCKTLLIVREEPDGIRRYVHIGTGNYHTGTARNYTDVGLFTCDPVLCQDVADLYNYLTGHSTFKAYKKLLVAPVNMRSRFQEMIHREIAHAEAGRPAHIMCKMNQLEDTEIINALYAAGQAGVKIDLIVRGFCCLRPGVPGLSENIRIMSIIGRFLEHSRIYRFSNGGAPEFYIGSADWMSRNLDWRVEAITPIEAEPLQKQLDTILKTCWADQAQAWDLNADGEYIRRKPRRGRGSQATFIKTFGKAAK